MQPPQRTQRSKSTATVVRRGQSLAFVDVDVVAGTALVAKALVTYKLG